MAPPVEPASEELVFGVWPSPDQQYEESFYPPQFVVLPRSVATAQAALWSALSAQTWGEMRATAPAEVYLEILGQAGFGDFDDFAKHLAVGTPVPGSMGEALRAYASKQDQELPNDEDPFDLYSLPSVGDGDFPPSPQLLMHDLLPNDVVVLGEIRETTFNGTFVEFSPDRADEILGLLKRMGYTCVNDQPLIEAQPFQD